MGNRDIFRHIELIYHLTLLHWIGSTRLHLWPKLVCHCWYVIWIHVTPNELNMQRNRRRKDQCFCYLGYILINTGNVVYEAAAPTAQTCTAPCSPKIEELDFYLGTLCGDTLMDIFTQTLFELHFYYIYCLPKRKIWQICMLQPQSNTFDF